MFHVYKHTCPNGKVYIGMTCGNPETRWNNGFGYAGNARFFADIVKYGWEHIEHTILHSVPAQTYAQYLEAQEIAHYQSDNPMYGYNKTHAGYQNPNHVKPVRQYDLNGTLVGEYSSIKEACDLTGANQGSVCSACKGRRKTANGFIWKYAR